MGKIIFVKLCRLCLKDCYSINIFEVSANGCVLYEVLNFVYNLEITPDDGLPPNICRTCLWKLKEFEIYKRNVHLAKKELLDIIRKNAVKIEIDADEMVTAGEENESIEIKETETVHTNANVTEGDTMGSNVMDKHNEMQTIKHEIDIVEMEIPVMQYETQKITEMVASASSNNFNEKIISAEKETVDSQEIGQKGKRRLECHHCGEKRDTKKEIVQHIEEAHKSLFNDNDQDQRKKQKNVRVFLKGKIFKCTACSYSCSQSYALKVHMRKHTGEKLFRCNICSYSFSQNEHLKTHMRTHTGERPYTCNICGLSFSQNVQLKVHISEHTGEKAYRCNICSYSCSQSGQFNLHMRKHTGERPFRCNICSYTCSQSSHLKRHMGKHTGEKPFRCNICNVRYARSESLKQHILKHTGEQPSE